MQRHDTELTYQELLNSMSHSSQLSTAVNEVLQE
jgi:hypothetical protein